MTELLAGIEALAVAEHLRVSRWTYPVVNGLHILGLALLYGAVVPLDLRLLGLWKSADVADLSRVLVPVGAAGLAVTLGTGLLLFATQATHYAGMTLFWAKMALVALALVNAGAATLMPARLPRSALAALSILCWTGAIFAGRFLGFA